jgi:hypothetical protein
MKSLLNIVIILAAIWILFGDKLKLPDIIKPEPVIIEIQKPDKFIEETANVKDLVPDDFELDFLIFNDEFAKKLNSYSDKSVTSQQIVGKLYPEALFEYVGLKNYNKQVKLADFIKFKRNFIEQNMFSQEKFLTSDEIKDLSKFYTAVAWNLSPK